MPSIPIPPIVIKLLGGLLAALALFLLVQDRNHWKGKATDRQAQLTVLCQDTRDASSNPKLECGKTGAQIIELGKALHTITGALDDQNAKIAALKAEGDRQQAEAAVAVKRAAGRADRASGTASRLDASSRAGERLTKPCEPSPTLQGAWK